MTSKFNPSPPPLEVITSGCLYCTAGNEWLHWGYPPCGAQRHMDLMCTSRLSVQVKGTKKWRLYPLLSREELEQRGLGNWTEVHTHQVVEICNIYMYVYH